MTRPMNMERKQEGHNLLTSAKLERDTDFGRAANSEVLALGYWMAEAFGLDGIPDTVAASFGRLVCEIDSTRRQVAEMTSARDALHSEIAGMTTRLANADENKAALEDLLYDIGQLPFKFANEHPAGRSLFDSYQKLSGR